MKRLKLFIPVFIFVVMSGFLYFGLGNDPTKVPSAMIGKPLPEFDLPTLESGTQQNFKSAELQGEPYLLNVWATWCAPCLVEHPYLYKLSQDGVKIVGVNYKDDADRAIGWLEKYKNPYAVTLFDEDGRLGFDLGLTGAPETFLVNSAGQITYRHVGIVDDAVWEQHFKAAFAEKGLAEVAP